MARRRTNKRTGEVQEEINGQWVTVKPAGASPAYSVQTKPADPTLPYDTRKAAADATTAEANAGTAAAIKQAEVEIKRLEIEAKKLEIEEAREGRADGEAADKRRAKIASLNSLVDQINRVQSLYEQDIAPTSGLAGALDYLPTEANRRFDTAGAGLAEQGLSAFRVPGVGSQSDAELRQFVQANRPQAGDYDTSIEEKLNQLRGRIVLVAHIAHRLADHGLQMRVSGEVLAADHVARIALGRRGERVALVHPVGQAPKRGLDEVRVRIEVALLARDRVGERVLRVIDRRSIPGACFSLLF